MRLKRSELPGILEISRQQVHKDIKEGLYGPGPDGLFDADEVRRGRECRSPFHGGRREAPWGMTAGRPPRKASEPSRAPRGPAAGEVPSVFREFVEAVARYQEAEDAADALPDNVAVDIACDEAFTRMHVAAARAVESANEACRSAGGRPNIYSEAPPAVRRLIGCFGVKESLPWSPEGDEVGELVWAWIKESLPAALQECQPSPGPTRPMS